MDVQLNVVSASPPITPHGAFRFLTLPFDAKMNVDVMRALLPTEIAPPPPSEYPVEPILVVSILPQSPLAGSLAKRSDVVDRGVHLRRGHLRLFGRNDDESVRRDARKEALPDVDGVRVAVAPDDDRMRDASLAVLRGGGAEDGDLVRAERAVAGVARDDRRTEAAVARRVVGNRREGAPVAPLHMPPAPVEPAPPDEPPVPADAPAPPAAASPSAPAAPAVPPQPPPLRRPMLPAAPARSCGAGRPCGTARAGGAARTAAVAIAA